MPVDFIQVDMLLRPDWAQLVRDARATHLIHLAWYAEHGLFWNSPLNWQWLQATTDLIEAFCNADGQHVTVTGTCAEYDWSYRYCVEDKTPLNPASLYGTAKDATRQIALAICQNKNIPLAWGRVFLPFGQGENENRLIPSVDKVLRRRKEPFSIYLNAYRDFLHASDVAEAIVALSKARTSGAYNISSERPVKLEELVRLVALLTGGDPNSLLALGHEKQNEPPLLVGENRKLRALGWNPKFTIENGLESYIKGLS